jgi:hypothetical protein
LSLPRGPYNFLKLQTSPWEIPILFLLWRSSVSLLCCPPLFRSPLPPPAAGQSTRRPALALIQSPAAPPWPYLLPALLTSSPFLPHPTQAKPSKFHCRSGHLGPPCLNSFRRRLCHLHLVLRRPCPLPTSRAPPSASTAASLLQLGPRFVVRMLQHATVEPLLCGRLWVCTSRGTGLCAARSGRRCGPYVALFPPGLHASGARLHPDFPEPRDRPPFVLSRC